VTDEEEVQSLGGFDARAKRAEANLAAIRAPCIRETRC
jgi:hypothetical protein